MTVFIIDFRGYERYIIIDIGILFVVDLVYCADGERGCLCVLRI